MMIEVGAIVVAHVGQPSEKFWGILLQMDALGVTLRAMSIATFEDFIAEAAQGEVPSVGLSTMFVPMQRLERLYLDEQIGQVESLSQRFERRVGLPVREYLGLEHDPQMGSLLRAKLRQPSNALH